MKFINYLENITGIGIYPMASLLIFVLFFTAVSIWVTQQDSGFISYMGNIPLDKENNEK
ncbi:MAG TPA: CcoQ/FixQ family Cbb3-type cytochrome c oxidase assembly chaperone [Chitinophagales bacterium]|jgi:cytochrome c oxidase cbb3-type subunit 4|nr:CcoQ/FixQ family Cbb3-type cytochrome c oxidase assembly chaperone [Chitinophagales bacterium]MBP6153472.1 CcoQ/FixQ family Cbb3-type cytochrome c oxidase assembly chaperone [Chitinophagales bacterium]HQV78091.1 CcoQ/FixQ family Cbb3-type cytochrome c oxidase assembly chaperone [Chitinophagales bacterium]HQW80098.1 CcoQ/FixQ family Cbb3-type cytochrome c oxidase assembly chaperone [Chitinophagales bacterium]HRB19505.1 CcoQ/FixQ family Cbb3-type cytochrome c oxidase assembly chaperone [Chitin